MIFVLCGLLRPCWKEVPLEMCWIVQTQLPELWGVMLLALTTIIVKVFRDLSAPLHGIFVFQLQRCSKCYPLAHLTDSQQQKALCTQPVCLVTASELIMCGWTIKLTNRTKKAISCHKGPSVCARSVASPNLWQQGMMFTCPWSIIPIDDNERFLNVVFSCCNKNWWRKYI